MEVIGGLGSERADLLVTSSVTRNEQDRYTFDLIDISDA